MGLLIKYFVPMLSQTERKDFLRRFKQQDTAIFMKTYFQDIIREGSH